MFFGVVAALARVLLNTAVRFSLTRSPTRIFAPIGHYEGLSNHAASFSFKRLPCPNTFLFLFTRWMRDRNLKDSGNIPSGEPGYNPPTIIIKKKLNYKIAGKHLW